MLWHLEVKPVPAGGTGDVLGSVTAGEGLGGMIMPSGYLFHHK